MTSAEIIAQGVIKDEDQYGLMLDHLFELIGLDEEGHNVSDQIKQVSDIIEVFEEANYSFGEPTKPTQHTQEDFQAFLREQGIEYEEVSAS